MTTAMETTRVVLCLLLTTITTEDLTEASMEATMEDSMEVTMEDSMEAISTMAEIITHTKAMEYLPTKE
jgi:hypothetical protein